MFPPIRLQLPTTFISTPTVGTTTEPTILTSVPTRIDFRSSKTFPASIKERIGFSAAPSSTEKTFLASTEKSPETGFAV